MVYLDGTLIGEAWDGEHSANSKSYSIEIEQVMKGEHTLSIVSSSLGIHNGISNQQPSSAQDKKGITGKVKLASMDLTSNGWNHWIGRSGERLDVATKGMDKVKWTQPMQTSEGMTWYKTDFVTPSEVSNDDGVILIDIGGKGEGMKRGHWWLNGMDMGHYNNVIMSGNMVQQYYFIPTDYFIADGGQNTLIFAEELANPTPLNVNIVFSTFVVP